MPTFRPGATELQERMFVAGELAGDPFLEVIRFDITLPIDIDPWRLHLAWSSAAARHEVLRLDVRSREPVPSLALTILRSDEPLSGEHLHVGVDTSHQLFWRPQSHASGVWTWLVHHAVADARTIELVAIDAFQRYAEPALAELPMTVYSDAIAALPRPRAAANARFWRDAQQDHQGDAAPLGARGQRVSHVWRQPATPAAGRDGYPRTSTRVLAAAALLAAESTGRSVVVIGNVYSQRPMLPGDLRDTVGPLINVLPLRIVVEPQLSVQDFLHRVRDVDLAARPHAAVPPPSDAPGDWAVCVNYHADDWRGRISAAARKAVGPSAHGADVDRRSALPLVLDVEGRIELHCRLDTWSGLYSRQRIADLARRFSELLTALEGPGDALVQSLGAPSVVHGPRLAVAPVSVPGLIREVARRSPRAAALWFEGHEISYRELEERSDRLADIIRAKGITPGTRVAVCLPRSADAVIALLAVLKAGAAYVPLEPDLPRRRVDFLLADTGASLVVTTSALSARFGTIARVELDVDSTTPASGAEPVPVQPGDTAYVIHTSGSTGTPKGVEVAHGSVVNLMRAQGSAFGIKPDDRVLQFASFGFDASVSEIFVTWSAGACLVIAAADGRSGEPLQASLHDGRVTMATLPPSVLAGLDPAVNEGLSTLITAGEPCPRWLVDTWGAGRRLINAYGPTEGTVCATTADLTSGDEIVIGQPIANVSVYLLDDQRRPVPRGATGEIYLGGAGVALRYTNRPELTAERFVTTPGSAGRIYRTGDLARMRPDGAVVFLGRADDQVKLRGFRIELGEVESVLVEHPAVTAAAALVVQEKLVSFVVPAVPRQLREWLAGRLPAHLVPGVVLSLSQLPVTSSGKIDRASLAESVLRWEHERPKTAPRTPREQRLAAVWAAVLGVAEVGVDENFFDLGGTSLHAARILARCRAEGIVVSPLIAGTVAAQAAAQAASRGPAGSTPASIPVRPRGGRRS